MEEQKKAYDLKLLGEHLKAQGLDLLEDGAGKAYVAVKEFLKESAKLSQTPYDDLVAPFYDQLDQVVLPQIDKIDGKIG